MIGSPPQPVLTRWGTWLHAAEYYAENLVEVRDIANSFEGNSVLVTRAKAAVNDLKKSNMTTDFCRSSSKRRQAHVDISHPDLKQYCMDIGCYIKKRMMKNCVKTTLSV